MELIKRGITVLLVINAVRRKQRAEVVLQIGSKPVTEFNIE
jgi:hypothetical protein